MASNRNYASPSIRRQAVEMIYEIMEKGAYANLLLEKRLRHTRLKAADRRLLTEIVNGSVRMIKHLDWVLDHFLRGGVSAQNPWLRTIVRMSAYQILFMDRMPDYAVVNEAVTIAGHKCGQHLARVVNGVLRSMLRGQSVSYPREELEYLAVYWSHPEWMVELFLRHYGLAEARKILAFDNQAPSLVLRGNSLLSSRDQLLEDLQGEGVLCRPSPLMPGSLRVEKTEGALTETRAFQSGRFYMQSEAASLAAIILQPRPGQLVYDLCCGVGGKSIHMAELMGNHGEIRCFDLYDQKLVLLEANCARMGVGIVKAHRADVTDLDQGLIPGQAVLLDAPCSGLGVLARRSDARWKKHYEDIEQLKILQASMLEGAASLVAAGGCLLYSTCTINPGENQEIIREFIRVNPDFYLEGFQSALSTWPLTSEDQGAANQGMICLLPGKYDTDGMFFALLRRKD